MPPGARRPVDPPQPQAHVETEKDRGPGGVSRVDEDQRGKRQGSLDDTRHNEAGNPGAFEVAERQRQAGVEQRQGQPAHDDNVLRVPEGQHKTEATEERCRPGPEGDPEKGEHRQPGEHMPGGQNHLDAQVQIPDQQVQERDDVEEQEAVELQERRARGEVVRPDGQFAGSDRPCRQRRIGHMQRPVPRPTHTSSGEVEPNEHDTTGRQYPETSAVCRENSPEQGGGGSRLRHDNRR